MALASHQNFQGSSGTGQIKTNTKYVANMLPTPQETSPVKSESTDVGGRSLRRQVSEIGALLTVYGGAGSEGKGESFDPPGNYHISPVFTDLSL